MIKFHEGLKPRGSINFLNDILVSVENDYEPV